MILPFGAPHSVFLHIINYKQKIFVWTKPEIFINVETHKRENSFWFLNPPDFKQNLNICCLFIIYRVTFNRIDFSIDFCQNVLDYLIEVKTWQEPVKTINQFVIIINKFVFISLNLISELPKLKQPYTKDMILPKNILCHLKLRR